ncbi:MAG TPA: hypothetical protein VNB64_01460 [Solirubrobacteraceae bacterium]|nr:hypothetical protein [Solirubrobacteraceae bacterium]
MGMDARHRIALAAALLVLLAAAPAAHARFFGANLSRAANNTHSCQSLVPFQAVPSCSWTTSGALFNPREGMVVPGNGRIVRVLVKVGNRTGPMRIAILQSLRRENSGEAACCIGRRQSRVFTPRRNAITSVPVSLPVSVRFNSQSRIYSFDSLFLTMENRFTPIPAHVAPDGSGNCSGGWFPAVRPGQENFTGPYGSCGTTILIRADWRPA